MAANPLTSTRIVQITLLIPFLILLAYCGTHRAWWTDIDGAIAIGGTSHILHRFSKDDLINLCLVIAAIPTLALSLTNTLLPFKLRTSINLAIEILLFFLWATAVGLMLRPKTGCDDSKNQYRDDDGGRCDPTGQWTLETKWLLRQNQPLWKWNLGAGFAAVEA